MAVVESKFIEAFKAKRAEPVMQKTKSCYRLLVSVNKQSQHCNECKEVSTCNIEDQVGSVDQQD